MNFVVTGKGGGGKTSEAACRGMMGLHVNKVKYVHIHV